MRVLQFEGDERDHKEIRNVLRTSGVSDVTWVKSVEAGIRYLDLGKGKVDVILSDLYLPIRIDGEPEWGAGNCVIRELKRRGLQIPVITISSAWMRVRDAYASIWLEENRDWERELRYCLKQIATEKDR